MTSIHDYQNNIQGVAPSSNTGAVTPNGEKSYIIDYLTMVFDAPALPFPMLVEKVTGYPLTVFDRKPGGFLHYSTHYQYLNIHIALDGINEHAFGGDTGNSVAFSFSGDGCRLLESRFPENFGWVEYLQDMISNGGRATRIDVARDDKHVVPFTLETIHKYYVEHAYTSRRRTFSFTDSVKNGRRGATFYAGSRQSNYMLRIYDKAAEQGVDFPWVRTEVEFRHEVAENIMQMISQNYSLHDLFKQACENSITFRDLSGLSHKDREPVAQWWADFLGSFTRITFSITKKVTSIYGTFKAIVKQYSSYFAALSDRLGADSVALLLDAISQNGRLKMDKHLSRLRSFDSDVILSDFLQIAVE